MPYGSGFTSACRCPTALTHSVGYGDNVAHGPPDCHKRTIPGRASVPFRGDQSLGLSSSQALTRPLRLDLLHVTEPSNAQQLIQSIATALALLVGCWLKRIARLGYLGQPSHVHNGCSFVASRLLPPPRPHRLRLQPLADASVTHERQHRTIVRPQ